MRVAEICPNCAAYINASCVLYDGVYLSTINVSQLNPLTTILANINSTFTARSGAGIPTTIPLFVGQLYINTSVPELWIGMGTTSKNWGKIGSISTTTTTTTV